MARWATKCVIAGVVFTGCRAEVIDGFQFLSNYKGSVDYGNSGLPNAQLVNTGVKGNKFGISMLSNEVTKIQQAQTAIDTALGLGNTFVVEIDDGIYSINVDAIPDLNQQWIQHGRHSEGWLESIVYRFVAQQVHTE